MYRLQRRHPSGINWHNHRPLLPHTLVQAAVFGKIQDINYYLKQGGDVNAKCPHGFTLLYYAATSTLEVSSMHIAQKVGNLPLVALLIRHGAEDYYNLPDNKVINRFGSEKLKEQLFLAKISLYSAVEGVKIGDYKTLKRYLDGGGCRKMLQEKILQTGAWRDSLLTELAIKGFPVSVLENISLNYKEESEPLLKHIIHQNKITLAHAVKVVIELLKEPEEKRVDLVDDYCLYFGPAFFSAFGRWHLNHAIEGIRRGNWNRIEEYLARGGWINMPDIFGRSLLFYAISCKQVAFVKELVARGAIDYNQTDQSFPYLYWIDVSIERSPINVVIEKQLSLYSNYGSKIDFLFSIRCVRIRRETEIALRKEIAQKGDLTEILLTEIVILTLQRRAYGLRLYHKLIEALENCPATNRFSRLLILYYLVAKNLFIPSNQDEVVEKIKNLEKEDTLLIMLKDVKKKAAEIIAVLPAIYQEDIEPLLKQIVFEKKIRIFHAINVLVALLREPQGKRRERVNDYCFYQGPTYFHYLHKCTLKGAINGAMEGDWNRIQDYLDRGGWINVPNTFGNSILHNAASYDQVEVVKRLIERGAIDYNRLSGLFSTMQRFQVIRSNLQTVIKHQLGLYSCEGTQIDFLFSLLPRRVEFNLIKEIQMRLEYKWDSLLANNIEIILIESIISAHKKFRFYALQFPVYHKLSKFLETIPSSDNRFRIVVHLYFLLKQNAFQPSYGIDVIKKAADLLVNPSLCPGIGNLSNTHTLFISTMYRKVTECISVQDFNSLDSFERVFKNYIAGIKQFATPFAAEFTSEEFLREVTPLTRWMGGEKISPSKRHATPFLHMGCNKEILQACLKKWEILLDNKNFDWDQEESIRKRSLAKSVLSLLSSNL